MTRSLAMVSGTAWYLWNFRRNVIKGLVADGWSVHVIAGHDDWSADLSALPGVKLHNWSVSLDGSNPFSELAALINCARLIRKIQPSMVFNNGIKANIYGGLASRFLGLPHVNNVSGLGMRIRRQDRMAKVLTKLYVAASSQADALLIQNMGDYSYLLDNGLPKDRRAIQTMGSGVDLKHFAFQPLTNLPPYKILFVGRLQKDKGIYDFVNAARILKQRNPAYQFIVAGGSQHANSGSVPSDVLAEWRNESIVEFVGHQTDVRPFLAQSHILVMPSHGGEGIPKVILEAAAIGRPAVVSDIDGCRDSIAPGETGFLSPPRDPEGLADVIEATCTQPFDQLQAVSRAARAKAEGAFSDDKIVEIYLELARAQTSA